MQRIKTRLILLHVLLICAGLILWSVQSSYAVAPNVVHIIQLNDDTINPVTADYIIQSIDAAYQDHAQCLIIKLDTPGGLLNSTRLIVKKMLTSQVPVVVYIAPSGSRAGSAGVFITYASHVAAMAPSTNIGAAHPVQLGEKSPQHPSEWGELRRLIEELKQSKDPKASNAPAESEAGTGEGGKEENVSPDPVPDENPMESKILHDTVAFIKSIARERGRNVEWGVDSVVKSDSITSEEALEKGVVEIIAKNDEDLLKQLDGRRVDINGKEVILDTKSADIVTVMMDPRQKFFNILANPNIAYFLMIFGFYGLLFEVTHPGFGVPGVLGIVFLILAFYSMQTLPTNYAGLALLVLGLVLLVTEAFTPTFGVLTLGGLTCMVLGSMLLFESVDPVMRVSMSAIYTFSILTAAITLFLVQAVLRSQRSKVQGGQEGLVGQIAEVRRPIAPGKKGKVFIHGEIWNAASLDSISEEEEVKVTAVQGLTLVVEKLKKEA